MTHSSPPRVSIMQCGRQVLQELSRAGPPLRCQMGKLRGMGFEVRETYISIPVLPLTGHVTPASVWICQLRDRHACCFQLPSVLIGLVIKHFKYQPWLQLGRYADPHRSPLLHQDPGLGGRERD